MGIDLKPGTRVKHKVDGQEMTVNKVRMIWITCTLDQPNTFGKLARWYITSRICHRDNLIILHKDPIQLLLFRFS